MAAHGIADRVVEGCLQLDPRDESVCLRVFARHEVRGCRQWYYYGVSGHAEGVEGVELREGVGQVG